VFDVFVGNAHVPELPKPLTITQTVLKSKNIDSQTDKSEMDLMVDNLDNNLWNNITSAVSDNNMYYECLTQIMDAKKVQSIENVRDYVRSTLKKGKNSNVVRSNLIALCESNLKTFGTILNNKLQDKYAKNSLENTKTKLDDLKKELAAKNRQLKNYESNVKLLKKEKRDLLNILHGYEVENIHKISLEKQLKAEKETNIKLREMAANIFKNKNPNLNFNYTYKNRR